MDKIIGAFIFPGVWQKWRQDDAQKIFGSLSKFGINSIFTESESYRDDLIELAHKMGLRWFGGISCFSDHTRNNQVLIDRPELWPINEDGERRHKMEWYLGITPTFEDYNASRIELAEQIVKNYEIDGFFFDFVRWPIHWELELRPKAPKPLQSSFDPHTIARFQKEKHVELPDNLSDTCAVANWILNNYKNDWENFRCQIITDFVLKATKCLRAARGLDFKIGLYTLPLPPDDIVDIAGQNIFELASIVDLISPMCYHAIMHQPAIWVSKILTDLSSALPNKVLPVVQVDSTEGVEAGVDWGPPVPPEEWSQITKIVVKETELRGLIAFTGTSLFRDGRGELLSSVLKTVKLI